MQREDIKTPDCLKELSVSFMSVSFHSLAVFQYRLDMDGAVTKRNACV